MTNSKPLTAAQLARITRLAAFVPAVLWLLALARALGGARHSFSELIPAAATAASMATVLWGCAAWTLLALARAQDERDRLRALFGKFVPPSVIADMVSDTGRPSRRCEVTVLLADIRDFTQLAETMEPKRLMVFLNDYFSRMVEIVQRNGGYVDKFMGDGLLAVFGAPMPLEDHAERAAACALEMHFKLGRFNAERNRSGLAPIRFGVALNSGTAAAGMVGSSERHEYTVVGDIVNTVARLEGLNSKLGTELLVTEPTYRATRGVYAYRPIGRICLKGRQEPVGVYQLLGPGTEAGAPRLARHGLAERPQRGVEAGCQVGDDLGVFDPAEIDPHVLGRA